MAKNENIFVKLQIEKDQNSGDLTLNIQFDKNAPNFINDKNEIRWSPTLAEIDFIEETFEMISHRKSQSSNRQYTANPPTPPPVESEKPPKLESEEQQFESLPKEEESKSSSPSSNAEGKDSQHKIFVQANEETIDEVLKRKIGDFDDGLIVEADEKTIIDRVLKQKKKGKWRE